MHSFRSVFGDHLLVTAFAVSVGVHATALAVHFVDPELLQIHAADQPLEIILVNSKSDTQPSNPEALAQVNLDGGGGNDSGRRTSPLPSSFEMRDGETLETARRVVQQLEEEQRRLLTQLASGDSQLSLPARAPLAAKGAGSSDEARQQLARMQAEIAQQISDYQKRPRKHYFMPSTSEYRFAHYVEDWRARVEKVGTANYPDEARGRTLSPVRVTVVIAKDGTLLDTIVHTRALPLTLERSVKHIAQLASPYPPFPPEIARDTDVLEITRTWLFAHDQFATRAAPAAEAQP